MGRRYPRKKDRKQEFQQNESHHGRGTTVPQKSKKFQVVGTNVCIMICCRAFGLDRWVCLFDYSPASWGMWPWERRGCGHRGHESEFGHRTPSCNQYQTRRSKNLFTFASVVLKSVILRNKLLGLAAQSNKGGHFQSSWSGLCLHSCKLNKNKLNRSSLPWPLHHLCHVCLCEGRGITISRSRNKR